MISYVSRNYRRDLPQPPPLLAIVAVKGAEAKAEGVEIDSGDDGLDEEQERHGAEEKGEEEGKQQKRTTANTRGISRGSRSVRLLNKDFRLVSEEDVPSGSMDLVLALGVVGELIDTFRGCVFEKRRKYSQKKAKNAQEDTYTNACVCCFGVCAAYNAN